jgi:RNA polymerase sigma factor (sigma-70 family)
MKDSSNPTLDNLLAHAGWLQRLAGGLLADRDAADEAVQETLITAVRRPPQPGGSVRAWFGTVLTNRIRSATRSDRRRVVASARAAAEPADPVRTPEEVVTALQLQRLIASLLLELDPPYREVIYLRFFDGLDSPAIGTRLGISAGTVRWRLKTGLDDLRARLDARDGEGGQRWRRSLAPLSPVALLGSGSLASSLPLPMLVLGAAALVVVVLGGALLVARALDRRERAAAALAAMGERPTAEERRAGPAAALPLPTFVATPAGPGGDEPSDPGSTEPAGALAALAPGGEGAGGGSPPADWARVAPFSGVRWRGDVPEVEIGDGWFELLSIDGLPSERIVAFCKQRFPQPANLWRKRCSEDLVEVLTGLGKPPGAKVSLETRSLTDGRRALVDAPMTAANRKRVWARNLNTPGNGPDLPPPPAAAGSAAPAAARSAAPARAARDFRRLSPFTGLKYVSGGINVELDGRWYQLLGVTGTATDRLIAFSQEKYGDRWKKRIAEDLFEVLTDLGARPAATVDLTLRDLTTNHTHERKAVPMTEANRRRLKDTWGPR